MARRRPTTCSPFPQGSPLASYPLPSQTTGTVDLNSQLRHTVGGLGDIAPNNTTLAVGSFVSGSLITSPPFFHGRLATGAEKRTLRLLSETLAACVKSLELKSGHTAGAGKLVICVTGTDVKMEAEVLARPAGGAGAVIRFRRLLGPLRGYVEAVEKLLEKIKTREVHY